MIQFYLSFPTFSSSLQEFLKNENPNYNGAFTTTHNQTPVFYNQLVRLLTFFLWAMSLLAHLRKTLMWTFWWLLSETKIGPNVTTLKNYFNIIFCCITSLLRTLQWHKSVYILKIQLEQQSQCHPQYIYFTPHPSNNLLLCKIVYKSY